MIGEGWFDAFDGILNAGGAPTLGVDVVKELINDSGIEELAVALVPNASGVAGNVEGPSTDEGPGPVRSSDDGAPLVDATPTAVLENPLKPEKSDLLCVK